MFLNVSYQNQEIYDQSFSSSNNATLAIPKLSSAKFVLDVNRLACGSEKNAHDCLVKTSVSLMTRLIRKLCSRRGAVFGIRSGMVATTKTFF